MKLTEKLLFESDPDNFYKLTDRRLSKLVEKLIIVNKNKKIGQVLFMAGGAGSGKGFAQEKFIDVSSYKIFDVDALKKRLIDLAKKKDPSSQMANLELNKPDDVFFLHKYVTDRGLAKKQIANVLKGANKDKGLPNLLFDVTLKDVSKFNKTSDELKDFGYSPKNMHLIWVLADYEIAIVNNATRPRVVPSDIMFQTHDGAATTMSKILKGSLPENLQGEVYVLLSEEKQTKLRQLSDVTGKDSDKGTAWTGKSALTGKGTITIKDFQYLKVKDIGKPVKSDSEIQQQVYDWVKNRVPKEARSAFD